MNDKTMVGHVSDGEWLEAGNARWPGAPGDLAPISG